MAVAIISEFNPFHNGHKYLVQSVKNITGESVIAIMSGSFVQRGEVAVAEKFERAKIALKNGVDLVVELPTVYAVSNAQRFASCGVGIAKSFDCVNYLAFGCEVNDINLLKTAADALNNVNVKKLVAESMKNGDYYPRALENAVNTVFGNDVSQVLSQPNNILAAEYLRALSNSGISPLPIKRKCVGHDSPNANNNVASASLIRQLMRNGDDVSNLVPNLVSKITYPENLERATILKLRSMSKKDFAKLPDVNEGLENRIFDSVHKYNSVEEIIFAIKTKRYTHARLRRIITCALLEITEELQQIPCDYARILGFSNEGERLLKTCRLETVTSPAKYLKKRSNDIRLLKKDILASDIAAIAYDNVSSCGTDFHTQIIKY